MEVNVIDAAAQLPLQTMRDICARRARHLVIDTRALAPDQAADWLAACVDLLHPREEDDMPMTPLCGIIVRPDARRFVPPAFENRIDIEVVEAAPGTDPLSEWNGHVAADIESGE